MWVLRARDAVGSPARPPRRGAGGDQHSRVFRIRAGDIKTMGRGSPADFVVDEALVSRLHCRLTAGGRELRVEDLESTNGTFVNDRRVEHSLLVMGDRLRLGRAEFEVAREDGSPVSPALR